VFLGVIRSQWMFSLTLILVHRWKYCHCFFPLLSNYYCSSLQCCVIFVLASPITFLAALVGFCVCRAKI
jgi:hypothetical protein